MQSLLTKRNRFGTIQEFIEQNKTNYYIQAFDFSTL